MGLAAKIAKSRIRRKRGIRKKIYGSADRPRISVKKSLKFISAQLVDDDKGVTLVSASTMEKDFKEKGKSVEAAKFVGEQLAKRAAEKNIKKAVFDRNGYPYHGKVKALADAARENGLEF